jgi:L-asparaginase
MTMDANSTLRLTMTQVIYVLTTGGTMEKMYSEQTGSVRNLDRKIDRYRRLLRLSDCEVNIVLPMNKDSLEMTVQDRVLILGMVRAILKENTPIIITHGTDTIVETGLYLQQAVPNLKTPIAVTGAMTPLGFEKSDGLQNLTESLMAVQLLYSSSNRVSISSCTELVIPFIASAKTMPKGVLSGRTNEMKLLSTK